MCLRSETTRYVLPKCHCILMAARMAHCLLCMHYMWLQTPSSLAHVCECVSVTERVCVCVCVCVCVTQAFHTPAVPDFTPISGTPSVAFTPGPEAAALAAAISAGERDTHTHTHTKARKHK